MATYRLYFVHVHIMGKFDFQADGDDRAVEITEILFDACCDRCRSWQLWEGDVFSRERATNSRRTTACLGFVRAQAGEHRPERGDHREQRMGDWIQRASPRGTRQTKGEQNRRVPLFVVLTRTFEAPLACQL
jgi:hypothetical protein